MWVSGVHIMFNLSLVAPGEQLGSEMHPISKPRPSALRAPFGSFSAQAGHLPHPKRHRPFVPLVAGEAADFSKSV